MNCSATGCTCPDAFESGRRIGRLYSPHECACAHCRKYRAMLDACAGLTLSDQQHRTLQWLSHWEAETCNNLIEIINQARSQRGTRHG